MFPPTFCRLYTLHGTMPKDKLDKKEKKEKKVIGLPEADDIEMADADEPKVCNKMIPLQFHYELFFCH